LRSKLQTHLQTVKNDLKNVEASQSVAKTNIFLSADMLKIPTNSNLVQNTTKTKAELINEINSATERIKILTNSFTSTLKSLDSAQSEKSDSNPQPPATPQPQRKRTFANMVWPMDPEEERILRSSSPYIVPEVIVQRNEGVKSILKKTSNSNSNTTSPSLNTNAGSNSSSPTSNMSNGNNTTNNASSGLGCSFGKKRVDFGENFLFFNFFDTHTDDEKSEKNLSPSNTVSNTLSINSNLNVTAVN